MRFGSSWYDPFKANASDIARFLSVDQALVKDTFSHLVMMYLQYKRVVIHFRFPDAFILINDCIHIVGATKA